MQAGQVNQINQAKQASQNSFHKKRWQNLGFRNVRTLYSTKKLTDLASNLP